MKDISIGCKQIEVSITFAIAIDKKVIKNLPDKLTKSLDKIKKLEYEGWCDDDNKFIFTITARTLGSILSKQQKMLNIIKNFIKENDYKILTKL